MNLEDRIIAALLTEIEQAAVNHPDFRPSSTYLGGGTPSCFKTVNIKKLLDQLNSCFNYKEGNAIEITIEINPDDVSLQKLKEYRTAGINRISLGTQSFNDQELRFLKRRHYAAQNHQAISIIREAGYENYSLDLIFALPGQTDEDFEYSLIKALEHHPAHISLYCLTYESGTLLYDMMTSGSIRILDDSLQAYFFRSAMRLLSREGYNQYELSNFAIAGYECRHNLNYWKMGNYLGFGPSAHSYFNDHRWANYTDINKYLLAIESGSRAVEFRETITRQMRSDEYLMLSLRMKEGIDLDKFQKVSGKDLLHFRQNIVSNLLKTELAEIRGTYLRLTRKGKVVADEITAQLV